jgi:MFS transporter, putative metabolite:H+ symporter
VSHSNVSNRIDRLPMSSFHKYILIALSFAYFFEFGDTNTFSGVAPKLIKLWGISINTIAYITSISFLGMFIGSLVGGRIADKLGRKKAITLTVLFFSIFSLLNGAAWNPVSVGIFRFFTGMGLAAMTVVANLYISEIFPGKSRGKYQALAIVIGICGTPVTSWISRFLVPLTLWSWRLVFVWGALGILVLLASRKLVESPRWYESKGQFDKADEVMKKIEDEISKERGPLPAPKKYEAPMKVKKVNVQSLFSGKYLKIMIILSILWIAETVGFFGYSSWAPTLLFKHGITVEKSLTYVAIATLGAPVGSYLASLISDRFERKWILTISGIVIALSGLLYGLTFNPLLIVLFGLMVNLFERVFTAVSYAYCPELFPTESRGIGSGIPFGIGRLSNIVGPLIISFIFTHNGYQNVFFFIAAVWLIGSLAVGLFGPKTKIKGLEKQDEIHSIVVN